MEEYKLETQWPSCHIFRYLHFDLYLRDLEIKLFNTSLRFKTILKNQLISVHQKSQSLKFT